MNIVISNKYSSMLQGIDIEIVKTLEGEYEVEEIINNFKNFYFNRMILDITALKDYKNIETLQKLSVALDMNKVILILDDSVELSSEDFISQIISIGIYNFTKNVEGILYLYNNPNTYRDVAHLHHLESFKNEETHQSTAQHNIYINNNNEEIQVINKGPRVIGFINVTEHAGATSLIYMLKNTLSTYYSVLGLEVEKNDFQFFNDKDLVSCKSIDVGNIIAKNTDKDIILIDINKNDEKILDICKDVIYLFEPSIIKLNKILSKNAHLLNDLKDKKLVLNKSLLNSKDVLDFEYESRLKVFYNMPNLNDREKQNKNIEEFLIKLGFIKLKKM